MWGHARHRLPYEQEFAHSHMPPTISEAVLYTEVALYHENSREVGSNVIVVFGGVVGWSGDVVPMPV